MLSFIGLGIYGHKGISIKALENLAECDYIYLERFTSPIYNLEIKNLESLINEKRGVSGSETGINKKNRQETNRKKSGEIKIEIVPRWYIEDGREILEKAVDNKIAIITYGDPFIATTLNELYSRAKKKQIHVEIIHSASGIPSLIGETGLHMYKFGRTVTIMADPNSAITVYNTIFENLKVGNHSLVLTEYNDNDIKKENISDNNDLEHDSFFFLDPKEALKNLIEVEYSNKYGVFTEDTFVIIASRIGTKDNRLVAGRVGTFLGSSSENIEFGKGPHSIIVPGKLHFTEIDFISNLYQNYDQIRDNSDYIKNISVDMVKNYAPKAKKAIKEMKKFINENKKITEKGIFEVLDNAELYIDDAERFQKQNKLELAVLSIGYAEGLIDALRFQWGINPWK